MHSSQSFGSNLEIAVYLKASAVAQLLANNVTTRSALLLELCAAGTRASTLLDLSQ